MFKWCCLVSGVGWWTHPLASRAGCERADPSTHELLPNWFDSLLCSKWLASGNMHWWIANGDLPVRQGRYQLSGQNLFVEQNASLVVGSDQRKPWKLVVIRAKMPCRCRTAVTKQVSIYGCQRNDELRLSGIHIDCWGSVLRHWFRRAVIQGTKWTAGEMHENGFDRALRNPFLRRCLHRVCRTFYSMCFLVCVSMWRKSVFRLSALKNCLDSIRERLYNRATRTGNIIREAMVGWGWMVWRAGLSLAGPGQLVQGAFAWTVNV